MWAYDNLNGVIRRMRELPQRAQLPQSLLQDESISGDFVIKRVLPPGPEREAVLARVIGDLEGKASKLEELAGQLRELVSRHDPVQLIPSIAVPALMGLVDPFADPTAPDDVTRTFGTEAKIEYLVGLALCGPPGSDNVDEMVTREAVQLVTDVFEAAQARMILRSRTRSEIDDIEFGSASFLLRFERLLDRMAGYEVHLEEIANAVFEPHREFYCAELGFCPSDVITSVRGHIAWCNFELEAARVAIHENMNSERIDNAIAAQSVHRFHQALEARYIWTPELLADSTNIPKLDISMAMQKMSAEFGCQPDYLTPFDENKARWYPIIRLSDHEYLVPDPWAIVHGLHNWLQNYIQNNSISNIVERYPKHRSDGAERLVSESLGAIFRNQAVYAGQHYDCSEGHGEIDCLVASSTPVIIEVKSRSLTEQGRRGLLQRIRTVARDVVDKSFDQTRRACTYIMEEGGREFSDRQGGKSVFLLPNNVNRPIEVVITMERMDPLALAAGELVSNGQAKGVWITSLSDFLMVRDILDDAASFMHYASVRGEASSLHSLRFYMESDVLETYLSDRLVTVLHDAANGEEGGRLILGYNSGKVNSFFILSGIDVEVEKPSTCVPISIVEALRECSPGYSEVWVAIALSVMSTPINEWRTWRRFLRRHREERTFLLPCGKAGIVVSTAVTQAEVRDESIPTLIIPRSKLAA